METKRKKTAKEETSRTNNEGIETESKLKKLSALGEWFYDPNAVPLIKIIDMKAVLR
jgi:hypothetical protein